MPVLPLPPQGFRGSSCQQHQQSRPPQPHLSSIRPRYPGHRSPPRLGSPSVFGHAGSARLKHELPAVRSQILRRILHSSTGVSRLHLCPRVPPQNLTAKDPSAEPTAQLLPHCGTHPPSPKGNLRI